MRMNFRLGWFRVEVFPRPKMMFDVRRTLFGGKKRRRRR